MKSVRGGHVGSIDVLKFLLAIAIVVMHAGQMFFDGDDYPFRMGGIAVEVFFVISGCLMCGSAERDAARSSGRSLGGDTVCFLWRKVRPLLVPYAIIIVIYLVCWHWETGVDLLAEEGRKAYLLRLFSYVPNLLLVSTAGIRQAGGLINITWYVSAMLLAMAVLYPLLRRYGRDFRLIAAPMAALFLMGFMYNAGEGLYKGRDQWLGIMTQGLMRAFIGLCLGCIAYEIASKLRSVVLTKLSRALLFAGVALICLTTWFVMMYGEETHCYSLALLFPVLVGMLFSGQMAGSSLFDNPVSSYLGRASMYVYLYHAAVRKVLVSFEILVTYRQALIIMLGGAFALFVVTDLVERCARRLTSEHGWNPRALFIDCS